MGALRVIRPGMLTTVQDEGRWGYQHLGVPVAGPMDWHAHALANRRAGNREDAATLEITLLGPELEAVEADVTGVVCGASFELTVAGRLHRGDAPFVLEPGQRVRFGARRAGARAYLAVAGGFAVPQTMGSRATSLTSRMGPFDGRALKAGDVLPVGPGPLRPGDAGRGLGLPDGGAQVRVLMGPHEHRFPPPARELFASSRYTVTPESNRMGYRLAGPALEMTAAADILSDATPIGSLQVPASGLPILLMADRQTTGGYPKIATVITADLPLAGQLAPGDWIQFVPCTAAEASTALKVRLAALEGADA